MPIYKIYGPSYHPLWPYIYGHIMMNIDSKAVVNCKHGKTSAMAGPVLYSHLLVYFWTGKMERITNFIFHDSVVVLLLLTHMGKVWFCELGKRDGQ